MIGYINSFFMALFTMFWIASVITVFLLLGIIVGVAKVVDMLHRITSFLAVGLLDLVGGDSRLKRFGGRG
ncbi:hypothetical protein F7U66_02075 [Vibrio parahaemolyticus]|nr:hypothetical protein [Vibrio parahaemolyticus]